MKRKTGHVAVMLMILALFITTACRQVPEEYAASKKYRLVWNDDPTSTMTIIWDQVQGKQASVYYGKEDHGRKYWKYTHELKPTRKLVNYYKMNTFYAELKHLEPDQKYFFVISDSTGVSQRYFFITAPDKPKAFTFMAGGDTKSNDEPLQAGRASNKMVAKLRPLFVMFNGDFNSGNGTNHERWHQWLADWDSLATTPDGRKIPLIPVHGNHENGNLTILNKIFNAPFQYNDSTNVYYSLSFGNGFVHILALNSEIDEGGKQREWLESNLSTNQAHTFKIAGYHKPFRPHTSRKRENDNQYEQWAGLFYKYGLDVSIDGDSHMHKITYPLKPSNAQGSAQGFIRDDQNGTLYIGEGSWGAHPRASDDDKPWTLQSASFNQVKWIHAKPGNGDMPASIEVYTVITGDYDENEKQRLYVDGVENLSDDDVFRIPANIRLFEGKYSEKSVKYPFHLNQDLLGTQ